MIHSFPADLKEQMIVPKGWSYSQNKLGYTHDKSGTFLPDLYVEKFGFNPRKKPQPKKVMEIKCQKCKDLLVKLYPYSSIKVNLSEDEIFCTKCLYNQSPYK